MAKKTATASPAPTAGGFEPKPSRAKLYSAWEGERVLDGFASIGRVEAELSKSQDDPMDQPRQFEKARHWFRRHWFIRSAILLRYAFYHFGMKITADGRRDKGRVSEWEENNRRMYRRYARDAWQEMLIQDNVVGLWRERGGKPPLVIPAERCTLVDIFGEEQLKIRHAMTQEQVSTLGAFALVELKEMARTPQELNLTHDNQVFGFDILRREKLGNGFGPPAVRPVFVCAAQLLSLEIGDAQLAAACREVMEQHLMGHEVKSGMFAGSNAHFWTQKRAMAFEGSVKGKSGHYKVTTNFDHRVIQAANWPKAELYDERKYASALNRLALWAMPLGQMILGKTLNPYLMPLLKQQAIAERDMMGEHLREVFVKGLGAPESIRITWSNRCFADTRIAADLLKSGLATGPLSQTTFLTEAGYEPDEEREYKAEEAGLPPSQTKPLFDAAHGDEKTKGRKPGSKDGDGK